MQRTPTFVLCCLLSLSALSGAAAGGAQDDGTQPARSASDEINGLRSRHGLDLYVGEGIATVKDDLGEARQSAKKRALEDLSGAIKIKVKGQVRDELKVAKGKADESVFESMIDTYVDAVLVNVKEAVYFDYPKKNAVTVLVYISKKEYDRSVTQDMQAKAGRVAKFAKEGLAALRVGAIAAAIENFTAGKQCLSDSFAALPVQADIYENGKPEDLGAFFQTRLAGIAGGLKMEAAEEKIVYNGEGHVNKAPAVYLTYEENGKRVPAENVPAYAVFVKGSGKITQAALKTGRLGELRIPVEEVDAAAKDAVIQAGVEPGYIGQTSRGDAPSCLVNLSRMKTVAYSVTFINNTSTIKPASVVDSVRAMLADYGYAMVEEALPGEVTPEELKTAAGTSTI
jgi:hypothetical protein